MVRKWEKRVCFHQHPDQKWHSYFPTLHPAPHRHKYIQKTFRKLVAQFEKFFLSFAEGSSHPVLRRNLTFGRFHAAHVQLFPSIVWKVWTAINCCWMLFNRAGHWWCGKKRKWKKNWQDFHLFCINVSLKINLRHRGWNLLCIQGTSLHFLSLLFSSLDLSFHWLKIAQPAPPNNFPQGAE